MKLVCRRQLNGMCTTLSVTHTLVRYSKNICLNDANHKEEEEEEE
jgi:hypothetical protein